MPFPARRALALAAALVLAPLAHAAAPLKPCRVDGIPTELQCGSLERPLDPARPDGVKVDIHYLVVPALARNKQPDAVLLLAGGPGQSAIKVAARVLPRLSRLNNRRDLVFIDQRGTGKSAPLDCPDDSKLSVAEQLEPAAQMRRIDECRATLEKLPYGKDGGLRFFTTTLAMQDMEAVRERLSVPQWNLVGASYGTRAAVEYLRLFPTKVRRTVIDGVAPPDMVLPASFSTDGQAALDKLFEAHAKTHPELRADWQKLLASLPRSVSVQQPLTGVAERFSVDRDLVMRSVRGPLYQPALAAALPAAIHAAASEANFAPLFGLTTAFGSSPSMRLAMGMHFSVICAEDASRIAESKDAPGADFRTVDAEMYARVCKAWPRGDVAPDFYKIPPAPSPVLVLSGGADPATPPRHGEHVAQALGAGHPERVQHIVVAEAGHGVMPVGCMRDLIFRFIDAKRDAAALPQDAACATRIPRPVAFQPVQAAK
ncbi:pimeloyl-ACP methyl ester carboxylesterase [Pelomonas saccharophila]|uniref:Pimeloyl-ACP methyl ester carboxylesterase n=1 Tax=Roseateles saccharophilus TaxID=304 RepID=A0ABU1YPU4_ROSSA|nr:alpha/beta fold hydrolase [Roseateles saccharophilus]MDR7270882.1 pimeloyl-ACP methyl ester carboxylesterase [Roseateles saccharophilus]